MQYKRLGKSSQFNLLICQSVNSIDDSEYDAAIQRIDKALELFPENKETRFYRIAALVAKYQAVSSQSLYAQIAASLDSFIAEKKNEHMLYYFRGILRLHQQEFTSALKDFNKAIGCSEGVVGKYYLWRARCYACTSMFSEAIDDLTTAINDNEELLDAYILRGKCAFINRDTRQAFADFRKLIRLRPEDAAMHMHAGNMLMASGAYDQAIRAYTNAHRLGKVLAALLGRAKCYVSLCDVPKALADLSIAVKGKFHKFKSDAEMLRIFNVLSESKGLEQIKVWEQAAKDISALISSETLNAKEHASSNYLQLMNNLELDNMLIFAQEDLIFYRGVVLFYVGKYAEALKVLSMMSNRTSRIHTC
eukprot:TRINITY_DN13709_c0_g1_i5.p1 TRINITY_DN13709_c0_g1~~TRINITY_DN13709_c0_g1_i5.p1  ORF type:complete len:363 (+),score=104.01 TRINITY_DN13709_c0_g1_i5:921-2009(+)